jgi:hypothetical protein
VQPALLVHREQPEQEVLRVKQVKPFYSLLKPSMVHQVLKAD